jgi:hypothetical protein
MYVLYYTSILRYWHLIWILVSTDHPCWGVGCHSWYQSCASIIWHWRTYFWKPAVRIRFNARIRTIVVLTGGKLTEIYFLYLLSTTTHLRQGKYSHVRWCEFWPRHLKARFAWGSPYRAVGADVRRAMRIIKCFYLFNRVTYLWICNKNGVFSDIYIYIYIRMLVFQCITPMT